MKKFIFIILGIALVFNLLIKNLNSAPTANIYITVSVVVPASNVHNITKNLWYNTINDALNQASNGDIIEVYPGIYNETIDLSGFSNLTLQAHSFIYGGTNTNTIIAGDNSNPVVEFNNTKKCSLIGFKIKYGKDQAIYITGNSYSNYILNNFIFSNSRYAINIDNNSAYGNSIKSNVIYLNYNGGADRGGIFIKDSDNNKIEYNRIYKFNDSGIVLRGSASSNYIFNNIVYSNTYGIKINDVAVGKNIILSNKCYENNYGIYVQNQQNGQDIIGNFTYKNFSDGIYIAKPNNKINFNNSYSNQNSGIYITTGSNNTNYGNKIFNNKYGIYIDNADNNIVLSNESFKNITGIYEFASDNTIIKKNIVKNNSTNGIYMVDNNKGTTKSFVIYNTIYSNNFYGIRLEGDFLDNTIVSSNSLFDNKNYGIYISQADLTKIYNNSLIKGSTNGIWIGTGSQNTTVSNNYIVNNFGYGIYAGEGTGLKINLNTIKSNYIGLIYNANVANANLNLNNIWTNTKWNFELAVNQVVYISNVWWGTTIVPDILSKISNDGTSANLKFVPYRLFGELNITPGADITNTQRITTLSATVVGGNNIALSWSKITDPDFVRYRIYRSTVSSFSNLSPANIVTQIYDANITTWTDKGLPNGTYYYHITYCDNPQPPLGSIYTNECWYSPQASKSISVHYIAVKTNSNIPQRLLFESQSNQTVMAIKITDQFGDNIKNLAISNAGTALNIIDITNVKLFRDNGLFPNLYDSGDTFIAKLNSANPKKWISTNLNIPGGDFIITVDIPIGASDYRSFQAYIPKGGVRCVAGSTNTNIAQNFSSQIIAPRTVHNITQDLWFTNIGTATSNANSGDVIEVFPEIYRENVFVKTNCKIRAYDFVYNNRNWTTIVDGNSGPYCFKVDGNKSVDIIGFKLKNAGFGGNGIVVYQNSASGQILNNIIFSNVNDGIKILDASPIVKSNFITNSQGISVFGNSAPVITYNRITRNSTGGIKISSVTNPNIVVANNEITFNFEGISIINFSSNISKISNNRISYNNRGVWISDSADIKIYKNEIEKNTNEGVYLTGSRRVQVLNNNILTNSKGISIFWTRNSRIDNNILFSNNRNVFITNSKAVTLTNNRIYYSSIGIQTFYSTNLRIVQNYITNNERGIYLANSSFSNIITNNNILKNKYSGIYFYGTRNNYIYNNLITFNSNGIEFNNSLGNIENYIYYNLIRNNTNGIWYSSSPNNNIILNTITSNRVGVNMNWIGGSLITLRKNNIDNNYLTNVINNTGNPQTILTNWFGTTIVTNIKKKIGGSQTIDFIPYRLFGRFNITPGADTFPPSQITSFTSQIVSGNNVALKWNSSIGAVRYFIYRATNSGAWSNFTRSSVLAIATSTNWTNKSLTDGTYYYWITALDNPGSIWTNETWYSAYQKVIIDTQPPAVVNLIKPTNNTLFTNKNITSTTHIWSSTFDSGTGLTNYSIKVTNILTGWVTNIITVSTNAITPFKEGIFNWFVKAYDRAGNFSVSKTNIYTIDTNIPSRVTLISPTNNTFTNSLTPIEFKWTKSIDNITGIDYYELQISTNNFASVWASFIINTTNRSVTNLKVGTNWWRVRAKDKAGHFSDYSSTNILRYQTWFGFAYFKITHNTNVYTGIWTPVKISAIETNLWGGERIATNYSGTITIFIKGTTTSIKASNASAGNFVTNLAGSRYTYTYAVSDKGVFNFYLKDNTSESVLIDVRSYDNHFDENNEGPLYFWLSNPVIENINPAGSIYSGNRYSTVDELTNIEITFSVLLDESTINTNSVRFINSSGKLLVNNIKIITNKTASWSNTIVKISVSLNETNDILKEFWLYVGTNIRSFLGSKITNSLVNPEFTAPYWRKYVTLVDKDYGAILTDSAGFKFSILPGDLKFDSYIKVNSIAYDDTKVLMANSLAEKNKFIEPITDYVSKEISGWTGNGGKVQFNNKVKIELPYKDADRNGIVDGTTIQVSKLKIFVLQPGKNEWKLVENSIVDYEHGVVIAEVSEIGIYTVMGYYGAGEFSESFITYPNPAILGKGQIVKIRFYLGKSAKLTIKIYTVTGEHVKTICEDKIFTEGEYDGDNALIWDGKNEKGVEVVSGVYLINVKGEYLDGSGKIKKLWKQGIVR